MVYRALADVVVLVHLAFILFVAAGALLVAKWPRVAWLHAPSLVWGLTAVTIGVDCPLTPLEKYLHRLGDEASYRGGFVDRYVEGVIYPEWLTPVLRAAVVVVVVLGYGHLLWSKKGAPWTSTSRPTSRRRSTRSTTS